MNSGTDIKSIRDEFKALSLMVHDKPLVYLDNAATTQTPQCVIDEIVAYYTNNRANVHRGAHHLSELASAKYNEARKTIAHYMGASSDKEIIFTKGVTESINLLAYTLIDHIEPGSEILITEMEHHSNIVPWYLLAKKHDLTLRVVPINDDGTLNMDEFYKCVSNKTAIASFCHASNALGTINPIKEMIAHAKEFGAITIIDGAQYGSHLDKKVNDLGVDFYAISAHKMFGPTGIGALYGRGDWFKKLAPYQGGGSMIKSVRFDTITFADPPQKFEAGTQNIAGVLGFKRAIDFILKIGPDTIHNQQVKLHNYAAEKLKEFNNLEIFGTAKNKVGIISFGIKGVHPHDISSIIDRQGVAIRGGHLCAEPIMKKFLVSAFNRASFSVYNTHEEIDTFIHALKKVYEVFRL